MSHALAVHAPAAEFRRGVCKYRGQVFGRNAYGAITSEKQLLHGSLFVVSDTVSDAALVAWLATELDRLDPVEGRGRHLKVVPRAVGASIDGPSPTHPARTAVLAAETAARVALVGQQWWELAYPIGDIMRGVCERLAAVS